MQQLMDDAEGGTAPQTIREVIDGVEKRDGRRQRVCLSVSHHPRDDDDASLVASQHEEEQVTVDHAAPPRELIDSRVVSRDAAASWHLGTGIATAVMSCRVVSCHVMPCRVMC